MTKILIDYSQKVISSASAIAKDLKGPDAELLLKHSTLFQLLKLKKKFNGEVIIAVDSRDSYWRTSNFPSYKKHRKHEKAKSDFLDWALVGRTMDSLKEDLKENFKFKILECKGAEADDIFGVLCKHSQENNLVACGLFDEPEDIVIDTTDGDMSQLLKYKNVKQWNNVKDSFVECKDPIALLNEHICRGDSGDNIPSILTSDQWSIDRANGIPPTRQKPFKSDRLEEFRINGIDACKTEDERVQYLRNKRLIDLSEIPDKIYTDIIEGYNNIQINGNSNKILSYLSKNRMKSLLDHVNQF